MTTDSPKPYLKLTLLLALVVGIATVNCLEIQPTNATTGCIVLSETEHTITLLTYPSSWQDSKYKYQPYKVTWNKTILNDYSLNPKMTFEGEFTHKEHDTDFSTLTGHEKDYNGLSVSEYLIKIEVA